MKRKCKAITETGAQCKNAPLSSSEYCFQHSPEVAEQRLEARRKGGQWSKRKSNPTAKHPRINTAKDLVKFMTGVIHGLHTGQLDPKIANAIAYSATVILKAWESHNYPFDPFPEGNRDIEVVIDMGEGLPRQGCLNNGSDDSEKEY